MITTCSGCSGLYEAGSEEQAYEPDRKCPSCVEMAKPEVQFERSASNAGLAIRDMAALSRADAQLRARLLAMIEELDGMSYPGAALDESSARALKGALEAISQGRSTAATDALIEHFDGLLLAGKFEVARRLLVRLDPQQLPPKVLSGVLMVSRAAKAALGEERAAFFERVRVALSETWRLSPGQVETICRRHA